MEQNQVNPFTAGLGDGNQDPNLALGRLLERISELEAEVVHLRTWVDRYQALVERTNEAILVIQGERLVFVNPQAIRLSGYSEEELTSKPFVEFIHPQDREKVIQRFYRRINQENVVSRYPFRILDSKGKTRWVEIHAVYVTWDGKPATLNSLTDISERKWAEDLLRERSQVLALLNQVGQQLTSTLDLKQIAEQLRQVAEEIIGAEGASVWLWEREKEGWLVCWTAVMHQTKRSPVNLRLPPGQGIAGWVAQTGESVIAPYTPDDPRFYPGIDKQIDYQTHSLIAVPLRVRDSVIGVMEVVNKLEGEFNENDLMVIETLAASAAIAIDNARLIEELHQRTLELQAHNEDLDTFADTVAHDLKNLLTRIIFHSAILETDLPTLPDELKSHLGIIREYAYRMGNIIDALLLLANVREIDKLELELLDMEGIVAEAQANVADQIEEYQAEITLPSSWPVAMGYTPWIERVWVNYISNAIRYGGRPPRIELGANVPSEDDGMISFWIRDNGPGLSPQDQARLFTPFTQLQQSRSKGHGLGLSIVRRIVEKLGGRVAVESHLGEGSVFSFTLPRAAGQQSSLAPER